MIGEMSHIALRYASYPPLIFSRSIVGTYLQDEDERILNKAGKHLVHIWHMVISVPHSLKGTTATNRCHILVQQV